MSKQTQEKVFVLPSTAHSARIETTLIRNIEVSSQSLPHTGTAKFVLDLECDAANEVLLALNQQAEASTDYHLPPGEVAIIQSLLNDKPPTVVIQNNRQSGANLTADEISVGDPLLARLWHTSLFYELGVVTALDVVPHHD